MSAPPATAARRALIGMRAVTDAAIRRLVLDEERIDVLAHCVLGYEIRPFHLDLLAFQAERHKSLQLAPRGYGKSTILTVTRAIFEVLKDPNIRIVVISNTQLQSEVFLREIKRHLEGNEILTRVFGQQLSDEKWHTSEIIVAGRTSRAKESTISCVGVGGPIVSRHYDVLLVDDIVDEENARTEGQRTKVREWFYRSLLPTLEPGGRIHLVGTRYHYLDLYGALIESEYADAHQVVRAIAADGSTPWPEKFSRELLDERRRSMGTLLFNGQYQNDVEAMKGRLFRADWLRYHDGAPAGLRIYQGVDLAISRRETADYFAVVTIGIDGHKNIYILDALQRHLTFKEQTDVISLKFAAYDPVQVAVEANAYQAAQVDELRRTTNVRVKPVTTTTDKVTRYMKLSARFEAGQVFLPRAGADDLVEQLLLAPEGKHDDLLDALDFAVQAATAAHSAANFTLPEIPDWWLERRRTGRRGAPRPPRPPSDFATHEDWLAHVQEHEETQRVIAKYRASRRRRRFRRRQKLSQPGSQWPFGDPWG